VPHLNRGSVSSQEWSRLSNVADAMFVDGQGRFVFTGDVVISTDETRIAAAAAGRARQIELCDGTLITFAPPDQMRISVRHPRR
jgi:hypothetical protein